MVEKGTMTGRVFCGRYEIEGRIGLGGMAEVYRAQDNVLGRIVAVKVMLPQYAADADFTQRFRQEAAAAANLQSPYIVNVYDWGQDNGTYFIVMEYVRGSDLKTAIKQRGAINQRKVAEIGSQVCQALTVAHNQDIIHRDIKPQNIMVQPDGNVKVMDFGIARAKNSIKQQTSNVLGTAHYISPEQAQGKELTAASDIYSLGIALYEATTGKLPFDGDDAVSVAMQQVREEPLPPSEINPKIDPDLEDIILCALSKNPHERFATANDMRLALNDYLAGRPVNLGKTARRNGFSNAETRVIGTVGSPAGAAAGIRTITPDATQAMPPMRGSGANVPPTNARNFRIDEPKKSRGPIIAAVVAVALIVIAAAAFFLTRGMGDDGIEVPDLYGMTVEQAERALDKAGFELGTTSSTFDAEAKEGTIIAQDPAEGTSKPEGTKINITVSQGQEMVIVPDLTNRTVDEAKKIAAEYGLELSGIGAAYSPEVELDRIMEQKPKEGTEVAKGSTIEYTLSLGTEIRDIPSVIGETESNAITRLRNAGFEVATESSYHPTVKEGVVFEQSPTGKAETGSTVAIHVSLGPEPAPEPEPEPEPGVDPEGGEDDPTVEPGGEGGGNTGDEA